MGWYILVLIYDNHVGNRIISCWNIDKSSNEFVNLGIINEIEIIQMLYRFNFSGAFVTNSRYVHN